MVLKRGVNLENIFKIIIRAKTVEEIKLNLTCSNKAQKQRNRVLLETLIDLEEEDDWLLTDLISEVIFSISSLEVVAISFRIQLQPLLFSSTSLRIEQNTRNQTH